MFPRLISSAVLRMKNFPRRSKLLLASFALLVLLALAESCCPEIRYLQPDGPFYETALAPKSPAANDTLDIVSFNIQYGKRIGRAVEEFREALVLRRADIILVQEIDENDMQKIARALRLNSVYYPSVLHVHGEHFGNGILTSLPILRHGKIILPYPNPICGHSRTAVFADLDWNNTSVRVYCAHTEVPSLGREKRLKQFEAILNSLPDSITHAVIGGDFNTLAESTVDTMDSLAKQRGLARVTRGVRYTVSSVLGILKFNLDHIYTRGFGLLDSGTYEDSKSSDHIPVWVKIRAK